jgi:general secretion pathway protein L
LPATDEVDPVELPLFARAAALACCGAMGGRHINLRGGELALQRTASTLWRNAKLLGVCAAALLCAVVFSIYARRSVLIEERAALRTGLANLTKQVFGTATSDPIQVEKLITGNATDDPMPRFDGFDAIDAISGMISADVTHDVMRLLIEVGDYNLEGQFELRGTLGSIEQRDALATQLGRHECFKDIKTGRTSPARDANRINYQIEAAIRCPSEGAPAKAKTVRRRSE